VLFHHHDVFDQQLPVVGKYPEYAPLLAFIPAGDDLHRVIAANVDSLMTIS
jgi:hypothetical protein